MLKIQKILFLLGICFIAVTLHAQDKIKVVASFSILGDFVQNIGGDKVEVITVVGADQDAHIYRPTPDLSKSLKDVKIVFLNGIGFDTWLDPYLDSAKFSGKVVVATTGIDPLHIFDTSKRKILDPHTWLTVKQAKVYLKNILQALVEVAPEYKTLFLENYQKYLRELDMLDQDIRSLFDKIPLEKRKVITAHDAFTSFGREYGLTFFAPQGISTEGEAKPKDITKLIDQIKREKIKAVFVENITNERLIRQIAEEANVQIGGTLYSDALSKSSAPASTYLNLMRHNATIIAAAL